MVTLRIISDKKGMIKKNNRGKEGNKLWKNGNGF